MANYARLDYHITGSEEDLRKFHDAIKAADKLCHDTWISDVKEQLGLPEGEPYFRGYITFYDLVDNQLLMSMEWAWWQDDTFCNWLKELFPSFNILWIGEEPGCVIYCTNDKNGDYFNDKYKVDGCINDEYFDEYFSSKDAMFEYVKNSIAKHIPNAVLEYDSVAELSDTCNGLVENINEDNYFHIHEYEYSQE